MKPRLLALSIALGTAACSAPRTPTPHRDASTLDVVEDDLDAALALARRRHQLVLVDAWAAWCPSCVAMREGALKDRRLAAEGRRFVLASIDTERESAARLLRDHPVDVWPTLIVLDPGTESEIARFGGSMTAPELVAFLDDAAARSAKGAPAGRSEEGQADNAAHAIDGRVAALCADDGDRARCADDGLALALALPPGTHRVNALLAVRARARGTLDATARTSLDTTLERAALDDDDAVSLDDRSAIFEVLVKQAQDDRREEEARSLAARWVAALERRVSREPSEHARATWDPHRMRAYLALGAPERAIALLEERERQQPDDYNAPTRLAMALVAAGRSEEARAAIARAEARVRGPRSLRVGAYAADLAKSAGDRASERRSLELALARTRTSVLSRKLVELRATLQARLDGLTASPSDDASADAGAPSATPAARR